MADEVVAVVHARTDGNPLFMIVECRAAPREAATSAVRRKAR